MGAFNSKFDDYYDDDDMELFKPPLGYRKSRKGKQISQFKPVSACQIQNESGVYIWQVDDMIKLQRFLFLGADNSFCYKTYNNQIKRQNALCIDRLIGDRKGKDVVKMIKDISLSGRATKQDPTMFALAICARSNDKETKEAAYDALNDICRIPTHLFLFIKYCEEMSSGTGWGRAHKRAVINWYMNKAKNPRALGRLVTKYKRREQWSHVDLFRLSHINLGGLKSDDTEEGMHKLDGLKVVVRYIIKGFVEAKNLADEQMGANESVIELVEYLKAADEAKRCTDEDRMVKLIRKYQLEREHLTTQLLNSKKVWEALMETIQMTAVVRNLGKMTQLGICSVGSLVENAILKKMADEEALKSHRVHPFNILLALTTYKLGHGEKGKLHWLPNPNIADALDKAFYLAFKAVKPTNKRYLLAIDVSGSMDVPCIGSSSITCRQAAAAMMMVTARTETISDVIAFSDKLTPVNITKEDDLESVISKTSGLPFGGTDCALPMIYAEEHNKAYDVFVVYTDNETWYGKIPPAKALQDYRVKMKNPEAKLIVVGMASNGFSIADPDDYGMLDIVGFDSGATSAIANFSMGEL